MTPSPLPPEPAAQLAHFSRHPESGLVNGITYHYTPEGRVDWRRMVDPKFLYIARDYEERVVKAQGKPLAEVDILSVKDDWLRIRLGGINQLANLRGYRSIEYDLVAATDGKAAAVCRMEFIGNFETEGLPIICSAIASATVRSVDRNFIPYLETFAENRAFSRCVKRALQINILSDIEVGGESKSAAAGGTDTVDDESSTSAPSTGFEPSHRLAEICNAHKPQPIPFASLKASAIKLYADTSVTPNEKVKADPALWTGFESIQPIDAWLLLAKIEAADKAVAEASKKPQKG